MAIAYRTLLDIPPIPVDGTSAARQAVVVAQRIADAGGVGPARTAGARAILDTVPADPPTELNRLRLLYRQAYTREELEGLVMSTFVDLGLAERT
jgi:hypothetical protein